MFSVRQGRWKLILGLGSGGFSDPKQLDPEPGGPEGQLYDMESDPQEQKNLWSEQPDVVESLTAILTRYQESGRSRP